MQTLQKAILCLTLCFLNYSCGQTTKNSETLQASKTIQLNGKTYILKEDINIPKVQLNKKTENKIIFHEIRDTQRNMILGYLPLPNDWKIKDQVDKDGVGVSGPNNIKVYAPRHDNFVYSQLPGFNQMCAEMGQQVKPLKSVEQLVKEEFVPLFANNGFKLIKQYRLPKQKAYDENYEQFVFKPVPMQKTFDVMSTEWEDKDGNMILFVIRQNIAYTQEACNWGYIANALEAPKAQFETAKNNYLYTLANSKYNPQWLQTCYMEDARASAQSNQLHQERMRGLRAEGQAIIDRGNAHSKMVDQNHKRFMDSHLERQTVSTPSSNTSYQVDAGSNVYWVNANGEYIPTNDFNFDPNLDPNLNGQTWTKGNINN